MTDKEMHRLSRRELLQLLLAQVSETEELKRLLAERDDQLTELHENYERLRKRLDQKDAKIHDLRNTLHEERTTRRIELQEAGSIAEAALRLNGIFDVAQKAADQYLENIKMLSDRLEAGEDIFSGEDISDIDWETDLDLTEPAQEEPDALQAPESQEEKGFPEEPEITGSRQDEESDTDSAPSMMDAEEDSGEEQTEPIDIDRLTGNRQWIVRRSGRPHSNRESRRSSGWRGASGAGSVPGPGNTAILESGSIPGTGDVPGTGTGSAQRVRCGQGAGYIPGTGNYTGTGSSARTGSFAGGGCGRPAWDAVRTGRGSPSGRGARIRWLERAGHITGGRAGIGRRCRPGVAGGI